MHRYALIPKLHMLHHSAMRMRQECEKAAYCTNPLSESVQMQEDFIGRPSRISRRVGDRVLHLRVLQRSLIAHEAALKAADGDRRF